MQVISGNHQRELQRQKELIYINNLKKFIERKKYRAMSILVKIVDNY
jgi:hypothetical protein